MSVKADVDVVLDNEKWWGIPTALTSAVWLIVPAAQTPLTLMGSQWTRMRRLVQLEFAENRKLKRHSRLQLWSLRTLVVPRKYPTW